MSALRLNDNFLKHCPGARAVAAGKGGWRRFFIAGTVAVLAGLTFLGGIAVLMRYETVMSEDGAMCTGELCVVFDRWTGETKPCTEEAIARRRSQRPDRADVARVVALVRLDHHAKRVEGDEEVIVAARQARVSAIDDRQGERDLERGAARGRRGLVRCRGR